MEVRLLVNRCMTFGVQRVGEIIDVSPSEAARMVEAEEAELLDQDIETATVDHSARESRVYRKAKHGTNALGN